MRNFQEKNKWQKFFESKPALVVLSLFVLFFAWSVFGFWSKMEDTYENKRLAAVRVEELKTEKQKLSGHISKLSTDVGVEETLRTKFGLSKEGEEVIVIIEDENNQNEPQEGKSGGILSFFKNWFK